MHACMMIDDHELGMMVDGDDTGRRDIWWLTSSMGTPRVSGSRKMQNSTAMNCQNAKKMNCNRTTTAMVITSFVIKAPALQMYRAWAGTTKRTASDL